MPAKKRKIKAKEAAPAESTDRTSSSTVDSNASSSAAAAAPAVNTDDSSSVAAALMGAPATAATAPNSATRRRAQSTVGRLFTPAATNATAKTIRMSSPAPMLTFATPVSETKGPNSWGAAWGNGHALLDTTSAEGAAANGAIRKLLFTTKDCITPYVGRQKIAEPMKVYLRIRPLDEKRLLSAAAAAADAKSGGSSSSSSAAGANATTNSLVAALAELKTVAASCMQVCDDKSAVNMAAPKDSASYKSANDRSGKYQFTQVFGPETSQSELYTTSVQSLVPAVLGGQNALVFAYGITNSGKTYTIQGTQSEPGIIPRLISDLFAAIKAAKAGAGASAAAAAGAAAPTIIPAAANVARVEVSYLEIYNEQIYDLLSHMSGANVTTDSGDDFAAETGAETGASSPASTSSAGTGGAQSTKNSTTAAAGSAFSFTSTAALNAAADKQRKQAAAAAEAAADANAADSSTVMSSTRKRKVLKLANDNSGAVFARELTHVSVASADDAFRLLRAGQRNRRMGETSLNAESSRSHSVFAIKLMSASGGVISKVSVVDLAGAERTVKTGNTGRRLNETKTINTSLMKLGRCLEALRWNQSNPTAVPKVVPFRESKITRLFKDALCGWGHVVMLTNASNHPLDFDETQHAMRYAAMAKKIVIEPKVYGNYKSAAEKERELAREKERETARADRAEAAREFKAAQHAQKGGSRATGTMGRASVKRAADKPVERLDTESSSRRQSEWDRDDMDGAGAASDVEDELDAAGGADAEFNEEQQQEIDALLDQVYELKRELLASEKRRADTELRTREEVVAEMEAAQKQVEEMFEKRLRVERAMAEEKYDKKLLVWKKAAVTSSASSSSAAADIAELLAAEQRVAAATVERLTSTHATALLTVQQTLAERTNELSSQRTTLAALQAQHTTTVDELSKLRDAEAESSRQVASLRAELVERERERERTAAAAAAAAAASATAAASSASAAASAQATAAAEAALAAVKAELKSAQSSASVAAAKHSETERELSSVQQKLSSVQETIKQQTAKLSELESKLAEATRALADDKKERTKLEKQIAKLKKDADDAKIVLKGKAANAEKEAAAAAAAAESSKKDIANEKQKYSALKTKLTLAETYQKKAETERDSAQQEIADLTKQLATAQSALTTAQSTLGASTKASQSQQLKERAEWMNLADSRTKERDSARDELQRVNKEHAESVSSFEAKLKAGDDERRTMTAAAAATTRQLSELKEEIDSVRSQLKRVEADNSELKKANEEMTELMNTALTAKPAEAAAGGDASAPPTPRSKIVRKPAAKKGKRAAAKKAGGTASAAGSVDFTDDVNSSGVWAVPAPKMPSRSSSSVVTAAPIVVTDMAFETPVKAPAPAAATVVVSLPPPATPLTSTLAKLPPPPLPVLPKEVVDSFQATKLTAVPAAATAAAPAAVPAGFMSPALSPIRAVDASLNQSLTVTIEPPTAVVPKPAAAAVAAPNLDDSDDQPLALKTKAAKPTAATAAAATVAAPARTSDPKKRKARATKTAKAPAAAATATDAAAAPTAAGPKKKKLKETATSSAAPSALESEMELKSILSDSEEVDKENSTVSVPALTLKAAAKAAAVKAIAAVEAAVAVVTKPKAAAKAAAAPAPAKTKAALAAQAAADAEWNSCVSPSKKVPIANEIVDPFAASPDKPKAAVAKKGRAAVTAPTASSAARSRTKATEEPAAAGVAATPVSRRTRGTRK